MWVLRLDSERIGVVGMFVGLHVSLDRPFERDRQRETLRGSYRGLQHKNRIGGYEGGREYFSFRREDLDSAGSLLFCMANPLATSTVPLRE